MNTKNKEFVNKSDISGFINKTSLDEKMKNLAEVSRIKSGAGENKKNKEPMTQVFLSVKVTSSMTDHKISYYLNKFSTFLQYELVLQKQ